MKPLADIARTPGVIDVTEDHHRSMETGLGQRIVRTDRDGSFLVSIGGEPHIKVHGLDRQGVGPCIGIAGQPLPDVGRDERGPPGVLSPARNRHAAARPAGRARGLSSVLPAPVEADRAETRDSAPAEGTRGEDA